jgi:hypothetical protein
MLEGGLELLVAVAALPILLGVFSWVAAMMHLLVLHGYDAEKSWNVGD